MVHNMADELGKDPFGSARGADGRPKPPAARRYVKYCEPNQRPTPNACSVSAATSVAQRLLASSETDVMLGQLMSRVA